MGALVKPAHRGHQHSARTNEYSIRDIRSDISVPGKCRSVKGMLPVELLSLAPESIFPHTAKEGASPHIIPLSSSFDWSILYRIHNDHQALHMCNAVMPFLFAGDSF